LRNVGKAIWRRPSAYQEVLIGSRSISMLCTVRVMRGIKPVDAGLD